MLNMDQVKDLETTHVDLYRNEMHEGNWCVP